MKRKWMERKRKRQERKRRYKKNHQGLFLSLKITCICYLAIFGTSYMTSGTSAFFSNQSTVGASIIAGTWVVPKYCGEEVEMEAGSREEVIVGGEKTEDNLVKDNNIGILPITENETGLINHQDEPIVENEIDSTQDIVDSVEPVSEEESMADSEQSVESSDEFNNDQVVTEEAIDESEQNIDISDELNSDQLVDDENLVEEVGEADVDCEELEDESIEVDEEATAPVVVDCKDEKTSTDEQDPTTLNEEIEQEITTDEEGKEECGNKEDGAIDESDNDSEPEDEQATEGSDEMDENENGENESGNNVDSDSSKNKQKPEVGDQVQPENKDTMPVTESEELKPNEGSLENKDPETATDATIIEENAEGNSNERENEQEEDKGNEMGK